MSLDNIDQQELAKFERMASSWWHPDSACKPLHAINPLRLQFIRKQVALRGQRALDIGCAGGLLTEGLAREGAIVTGIDASTELIAVACQHAQQQGLHIQYMVDTAENFSMKYTGQFAIVTCLELLEHVPDPNTLIQACSQLVQPGGHVFFATLNRHPKAYLLAILGAEYLLNLIPRGTHCYDRFIRPSELAAAARAAGLTIQCLQGLSYNPWTRQYYLSHDLHVNYWVHCRRHEG